jgi:hypothetical protein
LPNWSVVYDTTADAFVTASLNAIRSVHPAEPERGDMIRRFDRILETLEADPWQLLVNPVSRTSDPNVFRYPASDAEPLGLILEIRALERQIQVIRLHVRPPKGSSK